MTSVEAILELGEVARNVFIPNSMVGSHQTVLHISQHGVHPLEGLVLNGLFAGPCDHGLMPTPGILKPKKAAQAVSIDGEARR